MSALSEVPSGVVESVAVDVVYTEVGRRAGYESVHEDFFACLAGVAGGIPGIVAFTGVPLPLREPAVVGGVKLKKRGRRIYTPAGYYEKAVAMTLQRGRLADQLFYDPNRTSHRFFSRLLNTILKAPPIRQLLATERVGGAFVRSIARWVQRDMDKTISRERRRLARQTPPPDPMKNWAAAEEATTISEGNRPGAPGSN